MQVHGVPHMEAAFASAYLLSQPSHSQKTKGMSTEINHRCSAEVSRCEQSVQLCNPIQPLCFIPLGLRLHSVSSQSSRLQLKAQDEVCLILTIRWMPHAFHTGLDICHN